MFNNPPLPSFTPPPRAMILSSLSGYIFQVLASAMVDLTENIINLSDQSKTLEDALRFKGQLYAGYLVANGYNDEGSEFQIQYGELSRQLLRQLGEQPRDGILRALWIESQFAVIDRLIMMPQQPSELLKAIKEILAQ